MEGQRPHEVTLLILYLVTALVLGANVEGESDSCRMGQRYTGEMVSIAKAKENAERENGIVTVPKGSTVNSPSECEQGCCGYDNCTVYLFYPHPPNLSEDKKYNCFYLNCRPQELCSEALVNVSDRAEGSVVGIRDLQQDNAVMPQADGNAQKNLSTEKPASEVTSPPADLSHADVSSEKSSATPLPKTSANSTEKTINVTMKVEIEASATSLPKKLVRELYGDNHTSYPSLVLALGFGILFLCAAVVLIGRPWWFAFHRPRYSKVDYLMNGL